MTEYFPAFRPGELENDVAEMRQRVKTVLTRAGVLVEFRPHQVTVERFASVRPGNGYAVSTVDVAEVTEVDSGTAHVTLFDTGDEFAVPNLVGALAQLRGRIDHGRWLWTTRATRTRSNGAVVTTLAVHDEDQAAALVLRSEPEQEWAVDHPEVRLSVHRSGWSVLFTLSKLPGGRIVTRRGPGEPWTPETACLCGERGDQPHYFGCPKRVAEWSTPNGWLWRAVTDAPGVLWTFNRGDALAVADVRRLYGELTWFSDEGQAAEDKSNCPRTAEVIRDIVTASGGYLGSCDHCRWQGETYDRRADAQRDVDAHNAPAAGGAR